MTPLEQLYAVQQMDSAIDGLRHRRTHLPELARRRELDTRIVALAKRRAELDAQLKELANGAAVRDGELTAISVRRKELDRRLKSSSVPREAQGFTDELDTLTQRQRTIEDVELAAMEQVEAIESERDGVDVDLGSARAERAAVAETLAEADTLIERELQELTARRPTALGGIDQGLLTRYDKMRERLSGVAVAHLDKNRCDGCHLVLSATELDAIRREPPDALVECLHCGRLLVR